MVLRDNYAELTCCRVIAFLPDKDHVAVRIQLVVWCVHVAFAERLNLIVLAELKVLQGVYEAARLIC